MTLRKSARLLVVLALLFGTIVATAATGVAGPDSDRPAVRLKAAEFSPDGTTTAQGAVNARGRGYYIVQYGGPILQEQADALRRAGAEIMAYVPDFAYKVRMRPSTVGAVSGLAGVTWVGTFEADYKLSPDLAADGLYWVRTERGIDHAAVAAAIEAAGARIVSGNGDVLAIQADRATLDAVAAIADVAWVQNLVWREKHNEYGAGVIVGANTANASGYDGSTQIVAVADTGLGSGTAAGAHPDIPASRIVGVQDWPYTGGTICSFGRNSRSTAISDGAIDVDSGHGTHVSVSVLGDGTGTGLGTGTAPAASLVFQATEDYVSSTGFCSSLLPSGYYLLGLPDDLQELLQAAYAEGARIHSDSWGSSVAGDYTADAASVDTFIWDHPTFLMTTSAGNAGIDGNADGVVDADSMGSPATAKNLLTVGASENDRQGDWPCDSSIGNGCSGQNDIFTYGAAWPSDYPAPPISTDPSAGNAEQMAAFSSRGPTDDGRIKPDVVAPGTWILSGYSDLYQEGYDGATNPQNGAFQYDGWGYPVDDEYKYMGGTSMSNPITAGAAAVVRDYYEKAHGHDASAALTKATLINSAVDLLDENNDGVNDNDYPIPNVHEGWGRIDVANAVDGSAQWVDEANGVTTGGAMTYTFDTAGAADFKVSLVWTDYPSTETAAVNLVNDLDLTVSGPGGSYLGNVFSGGWSTTGGAADRLNNVENVYVEGAAAGTWTVTVTGFNVPMGPQPFALVVEGAGEPAPNTPPSASFTSSCTDATCSFTDTSSDTDGTVVSWSWDFGDGATSTAQDPSHSYAAKGTYSVSLTVTDDDGAVGMTSQSVTVTEPVGGATMHVLLLEGTSYSSGGRDWVAVVTVTVVDGGDQPVQGATVTGTWKRGEVSVCDTGETGSCVIEFAARGRNDEFTVTDITLDGYAYDAAANEMTSVIVSRP